MDETMMRYVVAKFNEDEKSPMTSKTTLFQLHQGVDPQFVHYVHGAIVSFLSRDDPLELRYVHSDDQERYSFIYCKSSHPDKPVAEVNARVVLSFDGKHPHCYVCNSDLCKSFQYSSAFVRVLDGSQKGFDAKLVSMKKEILLSFYQESVSGMCKKTKKTNFPPTEY